MAKLRIIRLIDTTINTTHDTAVMAKTKATTLAGSLVRRPLTMIAALPSTTINASTPGNSHIITKSDTSQLKRGARNIAFTVRAVRNSRAHNPSGAAEWRSDQALLRLHVDTRATPVDRGSEAGSRSPARSTVPAGSASARLRPPDLECAQYRAVPIGREGLIDKVAAASASLVSSRRALLVPLHLRTRLTFLPLLLAQLLPLLLLSWLLLPLLPS